MDLKCKDKVRTVLLREGIPAEGRVEDPQGVLLAHPLGKLSAIRSLQDVASVVPKLVPFNVSCIVPPNAATFFPLICPCVMKIGQHVVFTGFYVQPILLAPLGDHSIQVPLTFVSFNLSSKNKS